MARSNFGKAMFEKKKKTFAKEKMTSDDAYRVAARKGGKMNAGLKAYLAKKKKKKAKK